MDNSETQIIKDTFKNLDVLDISENQRYFLKSLQKYYKRNKKLSDRQFQVLKEIREHAENNRQMINNENRN